MTLFCSMFIVSVSDFTECPQTCSAYRKYGSINVLYILMRPFSFIAVLLLYSIPNVLFIFCLICFLTRCIATCRPIGAPGQKGLQIPIIEIMLRLANQKLTSLKRSLRTNKKYSLFRIDKLISPRYVINFNIVEKGGWHFSNIKSPEDIEKKFSNFLHHQDFEYSGLNLDDIKKMVENKKILYDHSADQKNYKWTGAKTLKKVDLSQLPDYIRENYKKYDNWLDI